MIKYNIIFLRRCVDGADRSVEQFPARFLRTLKQPFLQFLRAPSVLAWGVGAALTLFFTVLVNLAALRPVKDLKLTDVT